MPTEWTSPPVDLTVGERVEWHRRRRGLSRRELAELLGRSEEWLRLLETHGRGAERLGNLVELARVLRLTDLSALTGQRFSADTGLSLPEHPAVPAIRKALNQATLGPRSEPPGSPDQLRQRIEQAWLAWRMSATQYEALGNLLPGLLADSISLARMARGSERRAAHGLLAHAQLLAQRLAFCTNSVDLAARCTDRALLAAEEADDPRLLAMAGWSSAMTSLAAGAWAEAQETAMAAEKHVRGASRWEDEALRGSLLLFAAMGAARSRQVGQAWRHWDRAVEIASRIGYSYQHPQTLFSGVNVAIYGVALEVECGNASAAANRATLLDAKDMHSTNRRAQHFIDVARGHHRRSEPEAALEALMSSVEASKESIVYSSDARAVVADLVRTARRPDERLTRLGAHLGLL